MSKHILIRNRGEIEIEGLKLLGASTKREDSGKIGTFGSGLKYALAYLLRNESKFQLFTGDKEVIFSKENISLRDKSFQRVKVNGEDTSITTSWGENWKQWQIFREIVSNALDEPGFHISLVNRVKPRKGFTQFVLDYEEFKEVYDNLDHFFNFKLVDKEESEILKKKSPSKMSVYKKGVQVIQDAPYSLFNYHLPKIGLNEERIADSYNVSRSICSMLLTMENKNLIRTLYEAIVEGSDVYEVKEFLSKSYWIENLSEEWLEILNGGKYRILSRDKAEDISKIKGDQYADKNNIKYVPDSFFKLIKDSFGDRFKNTIADQDLEIDYQILETNDRQRKIINRCTDILEANGLATDLNIRVVEFYDATVLSRIEKRSILISEACFDLGLSTVLIRLLVESLRIKHKVKYQNELFELLLQVTSRVMLENF